ncbi:uncharacterized protein BKCO1_1110008 [Diplodia corticola]|uniref:Uncharacterized protein n=1 Tax=Diplodia corticola TaxID=236234 RepID=A0A1J9QJY9_9PEZI|nr:uncharacterized protein BKCO1_1110008 [Diplodia corticola]OJD28800.1 hypothetical protein BKCO1_1110008 [Diplodia corticola]
MARDNEHFFPDRHAGAGRRGDDGDDHGGADTTSGEYSADFQLPLPPLADEDAAFLRAVAARAEADASSSSSSASPSSSRGARRHQPLLRRLITAYGAESSARGMQRGLAPIYQGYLLRMSDGVSVDELISKQGPSDKRGREKL